MSAEGKQKEYMSYLCSRAQQLTKAIYRVTDMMSDQEPLKWKLRERAVALFSDLSCIKNMGYLQRLSYLPGIQMSTDEMILLLSLVEDENTISGTNFEILKDEYEAIKNYIEKESRANVFEDMFLGKRLEPPPKSIGHSSVGQPNGQDNNVRLNNFKTVDNNEINNIDTETKPEKSRIEKKKRTKTKTAVSSSTKERKNKVFETVKARGRVSVGEISSLFSDFSEKTIQRDLLEMVNQGILRKEGDKRWRTYYV